MDLQHYYPFLPSIRDPDEESVRRKDHSFNIQRSPSRMSNLLPPLKENVVSTPVCYDIYLIKSKYLSQFRLQEEYNAIVNQSKCSLLYQKLSSILKEVVRPHSALLLDPTFWLLNLAMFFNMLATIKLFIIYKDLSDFFGVGDYYYLAMTCVGIGDMLGRLSGGFLSSFNVRNIVN